MTGVKNSVDWTQSDAIAEALSAQGCHIVLETSPPDYVEKISRYLESSVGQSIRDKAPNDPAEADSDSGDSLFITQTPVPEAVRSGRRRRHYYRSRSDPGSPSDLLESEDEASSSQAGKESREKKCGLPKYSFPFLAQRKWKPRNTVLPVRQNTSLHNHAMGGFFKCVRELWQSYQRGEDLLLSLPTVYVDGEHISPLSEEEKSEDEDIKVVEKKRFVAPSKAKRQQTWGDQVKQPKKRKATCARQKNSEGTQRKVLHKTPAKSPVSRVTLLSSDTESSDDEGSSRKVLVEKKRNPEHVRRSLAQTWKTNRPLAQRDKKIQQKAREEELCSDSDATFCEPRKLQRSPRQHTQKRRKETETDTPTQNVLHIDDPSQPEEQPEGQHLLHGVPELLTDTGNDRAESSVKRRKKKENDKGDHKSVEEGEGQSQEGLHPATSLTGLSEDNGAEPLASQPGDELEFNENNGTENFSHNDNVPRQEEREIPHSEQKKKKRKKSQSAAENVGQEVDGNVESDVRVEDSVISARCDMEDGGTVKKKKKKKKKRSDEEQLQSVAKPLDDDAVTQKKKEKRKKEVMTEEREEEEVVLDRTLDLLPLFTGQLEESGHCLEESSYVKRKKHKKKRQSSANDAYQDEEEGVAGSFSNDAATLAESTEMPLKKKKKKKTVSEGGDIAHGHEENEEVENLDETLKTQEGHEEQNAEPVAKKKKKKKRTSEISKDNVAQNDDSASVRKKEKKKRTSSFLVADAEESGTQTHGEPNAAEFETELAAGNLEESNDGVRKKKKKKKRKMSEGQDSVEKDQEQDFEEPNETCQSSALPETPDTSVKRKKKRMGSESESVTPVERLENAADSGHCPTDEAAVLKKKKKKKSKDEPCHVIQESPPPATQDTESEKSTVNTSTPVSHKKKGKKLEEDTVDAFDYASPPSETPGNVALNDKKKKKKWKSIDNVSFEGESLTECAELEPKENKKKKKKERYITPSSPELSDSVVNSKCTKVKRRLHNPNDFFTGF